MDQYNKRIKTILSVTAVVVVAALVILAVGVSQGGGVTESTGDGPGSTPTTGEPVPECLTTVLNEEVRNGDDYVGLVFARCPSEGAFEAFTAAAARWSAIIDATSRPQANIGTFTSPNQICGFPSTVPIFEVNQEVDHLVIMVETLPIDGPGGILAGAGPCVATQEGQILLGGMQFDNADLDVTEADGSLQAVVTHEMGHVLGIGSFWGELLQNRSYTTLPTGEIIGSSNAKPTFVGEAATAEYSTLTGSEETGVPVEDGRDTNGNFFINVPNGEGVGSVDGHWKITEFNEELMTYAISPTPNHPLSRMSLASLGDLGYQVDLSLADEYQLPTNKEHKNIRGEEKVHILEGDVFNLFTTEEDMEKRFLTSTKH